MERIADRTHMLSVSVCRRSEQYLCHASVRAREMARAENWTVHLSIEHTAHSTAKRGSVRYISHFSRIPLHNIIYEQHIVSPMALFWPIHKYFIINRISGWCLYVLGNITSERMAVLELTVGCYQQCARMCRHIALRTVTFGIVVKIYSRFRIDASAQRFSLAGGNVSPTIITMHATVHVWCVSISRCGASQLRLFVGLHFPRSHASHSNFAYHPCLKLSSLKCLIWRPWMCVDERTNVRASMHTHTLSAQCERVVCSGAAMCCLAHIILYRRVHCSKRQTWWQTTSIVLWLMVWVCRKL